jgi:2-methylcitrate dehydratase
MPLLVEKFRNALQTRFAPRRCEAIMASCENLGQLETMPVHDFVGQFML